MAADPPSDNFVTSGPRARKPRIEVLAPGSSSASPEPAAPAGVASAHHDEPLAEPVERTHSTVPPRSTAAGSGPVASAPARKRRIAGIPLDSRTLLIALLGLGLLAILLGYTATQRGQELDSKGTQAAVDEESVAFPDDTDRYYEDEGVAADEQVAPVEVVEDEQLVAANAERAPGMRVELPTAPPVPAQRRPAATKAQPKAAAEARPEPRETAREDDDDDADSADSDTPPGFGERDPLQTVGAFYAALGQGDGASAASLVVPAKRRSGPLSAGELTRYFSSFERPLRIRRASAVDPDTVRVAYDYVLANGRLCRGEALVDVVPSGNRALISRIRSRGPC